MLLKGGHMRTNFDFTPYRRSTVGFDRLFDFLESATRSDQSDNYPPFDIEKLSDDSYRITLAVAGFKRDEIDITARQNLLVVTGRKAESRSKDGNFLHVGIATRARLEDGLLTIELLREIPEAMKPRKIEIGSGGAQTIEARTERQEQPQTENTEPTA
jgi:molecular chaperone IbpA